MLLDFLIEIVKIWGGEKLTKSNSKSITNHLNSDEFGVLAFSVQNILNARGSAEIVANLLILISCSPHNWRIRFLTAAIVSIKVAS